MDLNKLVVTPEGSIYQEHNLVRWQRIDGEPVNFFSLMETTLLMYAPILSVFTEEEAQSVVDLYSSRSEVSKESIDTVTEKYLIGIYGATKGKITRLNTENQKLAREIIKGALRKAVDGGLVLTNESDER